MNIIEIFVTLWFAGIIFFTFAKNERVRVFTITLVVLVGITGVSLLLLSGLKWQLIPLYIVMFVVLVVLFVQLYTSFSIKGKMRILSIIALSVLLFISVISNIVFPIYRLPKPTGEYLIGTTSAVLENEDKIELCSNEEGQNRRFKIQLWYPAETVEGYDRVPWLEDGVEVAKSLAIDTGLPSFTLNHTVDILSNSYKDAPIMEQDDSFPIVVISHGWRGFRNLHTDFAEELASHGYFVVSIDHSYGSVATDLGDETLYLNLEALPPREVNPNFLEDANKLVMTYSSDVVRTLDYIEEINLDDTSSFFEKLDVETIGVLGHSTGGGGDVASALVDDRIDSLIGLDAWVEPLLAEELEVGLEIPTLFLRSGDWETGLNNEDLYLLIENSDNSLFYQINGTTHYDFSMVYMYSWLTKYIGFTGDVEGRYLNRMLSNLIVTFFDETLLDEQDAFDVSIWFEVEEVVIE